MTGRTTEQHYNTREQVIEYLSAALVVVDEVGVPDELLVVAFVKAVDLLAAKQVTVEQIQPGVDLAALRGQH
jgi:hypothetical protein